MEEIYERRNDALEMNKTWDLVELSKDMKVVGCKWVYKLKKGVDDKVERYKQRMVEKGYSQKEGIDFHEIFSPVVKLVSVHVMLELVSLLDLEFEKIDVKKTFLHGDFDEDIYMCWLWSLIIFLIQRSLLSAVFIPHEVFTPQKYVHSSTRGSAEGGYPLCGVRGGYPPGWGVWGQAGPQRGFGGSEAPEAKISL
jgi:hypothetical protein